MLELYNDWMDWKGGAMLTRIVHKIIRIHPPEADAVCIAVGRTRAAAELIFARLNTIHAVLEREWEGNQKMIFQGELGSAIEHFNKILFPQLRSWEEKYRNYMVDKVIDIVEPYL
jgi:hypothetical protein